MEFMEENIAALKELGGKLRSLVNPAVELFVNRLREKGRSEISKLPEFSREKTVKITVSMRRVLPHVVLLVLSRH